MISYAWLRAKGTGHQSELGRRLGSAAVPTLAAWSDTNRIAAPEYGFAASEGLDAG